MLEFNELFRKIKEENATKFGEVAELAKKEERKNKMISAIIGFFLSIFIITKLLGLTNDPLVMGGANESVVTKILIICVCIFQLVIINFVIYIIISLIFGKHKREYVKIFKNNVVKMLIDNFYNDVQYYPNEGIPREVYKEDRYNEYYNRYNSEDYFRGKILDKYSIEMSEVKTQKVETRRVNGRSHTTRTTIFHGLFARIDMEKSLQTSLQIRKNNKTTKEKVQMDSQMFEEQFDVASDNKIITMQVLTHDVMDMLLSFLDATGIKFDISIYGNQMYFRFYTGGVLEIASLKAGAFDENTLKKYYDILEFTYTLSRKMIELIEDVKI